MTIAIYVRLSLEDWTIVADNREPLVTKELFSKAQEQLGGEQREMSTHNKWQNPLSKKVYCGVCGYAIVRRGTKNRWQNEFQWQTELLLQAQGQLPGREMV